MNTQALDSTVSAFRLFTTPHRSSVHPHEIRPESVEGEKAERRSRDLSPDPQKILENRLNDSLRKVVDNHFKSVPASNKQAFDTDRFTDRLLANIAKAYGRQSKTDPNFDKAEFFKQVKQGLTQGYAQAREAANQLGASDTQNVRLNETYTKIQAGLAKLESLSGVESRSQLQLQSFATQTRQSAEIEIVTQEGDVVKIQLAASNSTSQTAFKLQQDGLESSGFATSTENSADYMISVQGDLNQDEQASLTKLLKQIHHVGKELSQDNIQTAFKQAQKIGLDTEQLASFSMQLTMQQSVQAVVAYQQTADPEQNVDSGQMKLIADFFNRSRTVLQSEQPVLQSFANPGAAFNALVAGVDQLLAAQNPQNQATTLPEVTKALGLPQSSA